MIVSHSRIWVYVLSKKCKIVCSSFLFCLTDKKLKYWSWNWITFHQNVFAHVDKHRKVDNFYQNAFAHVDKHRKVDNFPSKCFCTCRQTTKSRYFFIVSTRTTMHWWSLSCQNALIYCWNTQIWRFIHCLVLKKLFW